MSSDLLQAVEVSLKAEKAKLEKATVHWYKVHDQLVEASTEVQTSTTEVQRIESAVRALKGESVNHVTTGDVRDELVPEDAPHEKPKRKKKDRNDPDNPYADIPCNGCGVKGRLREQVQNTGGKVYRQLLCLACNNVSML